MFLLKRRSSPQHFARESYPPTIPYLCFEEKRALGQYCCIHPSVHVLVATRIYFAIASKQSQCKRTDAAPAERPRGPMASL